MAQADMTLRASGVAIREERDRQDVRARHATLVRSFEGLEPDAAVRQERVRGSCPVRS